MAVVSVVKQALKTGDALPEVLPTPVIKICYEYCRDMNAKTNMNMRTGTVGLSGGLVRDKTIVNSAWL